MFDILSSHASEYQQAYAMQTHPPAWKPQCQLITAAELPELFAKHHIVVIHCGAVWNGIDLPFDASIQEVKPQFPEHIGFYALDIDEQANREFCAYCTIVNIPALVCFINGFWQETAIGASPKPELIVRLRYWNTMANTGYITAKEQNTWEVSLTQPLYLTRSRKLRHTYHNIRHGVTLRTGAATENNLSFSVTQDYEDVRYKRIAACRALGFEAEQLVIPAQTHGANVAVVGAKDAGRGATFPDTAIPNCDALVTNTPGLLLGITIADCLPVFFLDPVHHAIGLAHSGWCGTAGRIAVRTLETMRQHFGTQPNDCLIAIGPGIGPDGYEVDQKVYDGFTPEDRKILGAFTPTRTGHWQLDLYAAVCHQLRQSGIPTFNFDVCRYRTNRHTDLFFSHRLVPGCGRMGAFIGLSAKTV